MRIELPWKTPTINHLYGQHGKVKYLKPEAKGLREEIKKIIFRMDLSDMHDKDSHLQVHVQVLEDWYCKNGTVKRKDVSNREKFLIDSIFEALELDDKMIFKHTMEKIQSDHEGCIIDITKYTTEDTNGN